MRAALAAILATLLAGCATVQTSRDFTGIKLSDGGDPVAVVAVQNSGWYLFGCLPIVSGDPAHPNGMSFRLFSDTVTLENNIAMLSETCRKEGTYHTEDLLSRVRNDLAIGLFLFGRKMVFTSAVITK